MEKDKLIVFIGAISDLRIFTLSGSSLRLILEDSLKDFQVRVKLGLIVLLFALEGFLDLSLLAQKFFVTKKFTHRIVNFCSFLITCLCHMDFPYSQPLGGTSPLRCGADSRIHRSENQLFWEAVNWFEDAQETCWSQYSADGTYRHHFLGCSFKKVGCWRG